MAIERSGRRVAETRIRTVTHGLLEASTLCAIATVTPESRAHINTAYFAWSPAREPFTEPPRECVGGDRGVRLEAVLGQA
jgi:hypothetical protein